MFEIVAEGESKLFRMTRDGEWMVFPMSTLVLESVAKLDLAQICQLAKDKQQRWVTDDWSIQGSDGSRGGRDKYGERLWLTIGNRTWHFEVGEVFGLVEDAQIALGNARIE